MYPCSLTVVKSEKDFKFGLTPVQIFLSSPVILLSFISRFALVRYQIDSNVTGSHKKIGRAAYLDRMPLESISQAQGGLTLRQLKHIF